MLALLSAFVILLVAKPTVASSSNSRALMQANYSTIYMPRNTSMEQMRSSYRWQSIQRAYSNRVRRIMHLCSRAIEADLPHKKLATEVYQRVKQRCKRTFRHLKQAFLHDNANKHVMFFHSVFMVGGGTLMMCIPMLSTFYTEELNLSHWQIAVARFVFMTIGLAISSFAWKRFITSCGVLYSLPRILVGFSMFLFLIVSATSSIYYFYGAFFVYGCTQAGSQLAWSYMPIENAERNSTTTISISQASLLLAGLRGAALPALGFWLTGMVSYKAALLCASIALLAFAGSAKLVLTQKYELEYVNESR